jgi:hypothetical protein
VRLDPRFYSNAPELQQASQLGRLNITTTTGDEDGDSDIERLHVLGGRSYTIGDADAKHFYDSRNELEAELEAKFIFNFNASNSSNTRDNRCDDRSGDKGPIPTRSRSDQSVAAPAPPSAMRAKTTSSSTLRRTRYIGQWWNHNFSAATTIWQIN